MNGHIPTPRRARSAKVRDGSISTRRDGCYRHRVAGKNTCLRHQSGATGRGDVSWFSHCGTHSTAIDFYQPICIEHLPEMLPLVMKYLCLPTGAKFIIDIQGYEDVWMAE
ncbi:immunity protein Imm33 domain-containing protein [Pseudomonas zeae]|uniref:immunity protein Imm33 domain-containing protein n=1 Tax=Pseudomonas zeae TaxID=2745510 RepID=UPI003FA3BB48